MRTDSFYLSVMSINNFFANGTTYSATFVLISTIQTEIRLEDTVNVLRVETDTIILYRNIPETIFILLRGQFKFRSLLFLFKFDSFTDQVL